MTYIPLKRPKTKHIITEPISSIKCDNPSCDHIEHDIDFEAQQESYFGKPCPKCGQDLYTQAHYDEMKTIFDKAAKADAFAETMSQRMQMANEGKVEYPTDEAIADLSTFLGMLADLASHDQVRFTGIKEKPL